jgi:uncharacterized protein (TIGR04168 family)
MTQAGKPQTYAGDTLDASATAPVRIALIGDVHSAWDTRDVEYFNQSAYPLLLIAGDLGGSRARDGLRIARSMAGLERRALVIPGNNDVDEYASIAAELAYRQGQADLLDDQPAAIDAAPHRPRTCGYSVHPMRLGELELTVIAGRPFSKGGAELSSPEALERSFGIRSMQESAQRLRQLVDSVRTEHLLFFAHNGPWGLGARRDDLWGRDFDPAAGDWGDRDLHEAIEHACASGRKPLAVVGGHMHWSLRGGGQRRWQLQDRGILYVNTARVPRLFANEQGRQRQHIALELSALGARAEQVFVADPGSDG